MRTTIALLVATLLLSACGGSSGETELAGSQTEGSEATPDATPTETEEATVPDDPTTEATPEVPSEGVATPEEQESESLLDGTGGTPARIPATELTGTLGGDDALEGGCAWIDGPDGRYEVLYPEGYTVEFGPVRIVGPDGEVVAEQGDTVTVAGAPAEGMMSICQVGQMWQAESVEAG